MNRHSTILRIALPSMDDQSRAEVRGILRSLLTAVYHDLQESSTKNYEFLVRERLNKRDKTFLTHALRVYYDKHCDRKESYLNESTSSIGLTFLVESRLKFYGGDE